MVPCLCGCVRTCAGATCVLCVSACWHSGTKGALYMKHRGKSAHKKTLEHSFSGALSYAQASFLGHMMSSRVREEDVGKMLF